MNFDPGEYIQGHELIAVDGDWPNFHDAEVHFISFWKGDVRPEDQVWIGPRIEIDFELCALEKPFFVKMAFSDCTEIQLNASQTEPVVYDLEFALIARGADLKGRPLPLWIGVRFKANNGLQMSFKCMRIEVLERYETLRKK